MMSNLVNYGLTAEGVIVKYRPLKNTPETRINTGFFDNKKFFELKKCNC